VCGAVIDEHNFWNHPHKEYREYTDADYRPIEELLRK
jgi:hypothetical protein